MGYVEIFAAWLIAIIAVNRYTFHVLTTDTKEGVNVSPVQWIHILVLRLALDQGGSMPFSIYAKSPVVQLVDDFLAANSVSSVYSKPITHAQTLKRILETLTGLGLVSEAEGIITLTPAGRDLLTRLGDNWKVWPRLLPFNDGEPDFDNADYI